MRSVVARIVFYAMAHRGDVFPYVPIASELARRGHDVTYVVPREFHPLFASEPFRCVHSGTDFSPVALDEHGAYIARWGMRFGGTFVLRLYFGTFTIPHLDALFEAIDAEVASADLLVSHPAAALVGAMACERRDVPWIAADLFPMLVPTACAPPAGMPDLGRRANRALWRAGRSPRLGFATSGNDFKAFRTRLGLATSESWNVVDARLSPHLNLGLVSPHYVQAQPDWPENYRLVGFTPWAGPDHGAIPDVVSAFLTSGPSPVIVTLGTSGASARPEVFLQVAAALDAIGQRGLFLTSNEAIADRVSAGGISRAHGVWPFVPLSPLLEHAAAVVQSGAHGTNALTLTAGLPSVIVPCLFDQVWHARRQAELGTGVWVRRQRDLAPAVERVVGDHAMADRARDLGALIGNEDGTRNACDEVEAFLGHKLDV